MADKLQFKFSHRFRGNVWNIVAVPEQEVMIFEIRDQTTKTAVFDALQYQSNSFLWRNFSLEESWWVSLNAAHADMMLFTIYLEQQNPDRKGVMAYELSSRALRWWNNDFTLVSVDRQTVVGFSSKFGQRQLLLDLHTGHELAHPIPEQTTAAPGVVGPAQYIEGSAHFTTVKTFLANKLNLAVVAALEYLEYGDHILISYYVTENELANYLIVFDRSGSVRLHEKLDEHLKGIGLDTFFVLSGCLFFVKNRVELVSYFL